ncbi:hypothetical protein JZ751_015525 [Albula glossodonta]|uniref:Uncharacterized protein n=1 Tax=Albula glossodonta TaxID=121402 RepID=A0A8T2MW95_9TELE|nr:hypothetical protein JZ751_015525 [Albula glossodonta]
MYLFRSVTDRADPQVVGAEGSCEGYETECSWLWVWFCPVLGKAVCYRRALSSCTVSPESRRASFRNYSG